MHLIKVMFVTVITVGWAVLAPGAGVCQVLPSDNRVDLAHELKALYDPGQLPLFLPGCTEQQVSSYDRTGGNDDGFSGRYSYVRRNADSGLVMAEVYGAGVVHRIATPTPTNDTLDIFIDDSVRPRMSLCFMDLFSGKVKPFAAPLCDHGAGGYYCYFPILFQRFCRIVSRGKKLQFYQLQYKTFPAGTGVESFRPELSEQERVALAKISSVWSGEGGFHDEVAASSEKKVAHVVLKPGGSALVANLASPGRVTGIELCGAGVLGDPLRDIWLEVSADGEAEPAVDVPVAAFFGYAAGKPSMRSVMAGTRGDTCYSWFPMPYDQHMRLRLVYRGKGAPVHVAATVYYTDQPRDRSAEGEFRAHYVSDELTAHDPWHVFLHTQGRGHYVGTILLAQGKKPGLPLFFEGDDSTATDGIFRIHGTGSEDYFNGGWYDLPGRWDTARSFPLSGCLVYDKVAGQTGGYRFYLSDKIPFQHSIWSGIEHGQSAREPIPARYRSVSFYYVDTVAAAVRK